MNGQVTFKQIKTNKLNTHILCMCTLTKEKMYIIMLKK